MIVMDDVMGCSWGDYPQEVEVWDVGFRGYERE